MFGLEKSNHEYTNTAGKIHGSIELKGGHVLGLTPSQLMNEPFDVYMRNACRLLAHTVR